MERLVRCGARTVVGLDLSAGMLRQARRKDGLGGLLLEADVMSIPLQTSSIDFALCAFGLSYASDLQRTANELSRITRAKGHLIISDFHPSAQTRGWKRAFRHEGCVVEIASVNRPLDEISKSFEREGFSPVLLLEPEFGEAEKPIFEKSGKSVLLPRVLGQVALFVFVFRKVSG
jgi:ubiquinone/menaquinone biosynthesis C-methylase UbiE